MIETVPYPPEAQAIPIAGACGWTQPGDTRAVLWLAAQTLGPILEIGCADGWTTRELATRFPHRKIIAVDYAGPDRTTCDDQRPYDAANDAVIACQAAHLPNVEIIRCKSHLLDYDAAAGGEPIGFVFIDGDHSYAGVRVDTLKALGYWLATKQKDPDHKMIMAWHDCYETDEKTRWVGVLDYLKKEMEAYVPRTTIPRENIV